MPRTLHGVLPIIHTPFDENDQIDAADLRREIDWIFSVGAHGIGSGMVSEILRLTAAERVALTEQMVALTAGRGAVFAGVGAESSKQACELARAAERAGCDAVMAVPPLTTRLSSESTTAYFRSIADAVSLPVIVQDASGYVGHAIPLDVYIRLLDEYGAEKIVFKPEAAPIGPNLSALRDASGGRAAIYEGSGGILLVDSFRRGIKGTMPGVDLLDGVVALWNALEAGDEERIYRLYFPICALVALQLQAGLDGFLAIEKYLLVERGVFCSERRREPNGWQLDPETRDEVDRLFALMKRAIAESR